MTFVLRYEAWPEEEGQGERLPEYEYVEIEARDYDEAVNKAKLLQVVQNALSVLIFGRGKTEPRIHYFGGGEHVTELPAMILALEEEPLSDIIYRQAKGTLPDPPKSA